MERRKSLTNSPGGLLGGSSPRDSPLGMRPALRELEEIKKHASPLVSLSILYPLKIVSI